MNNVDGFVESLMDVIEDFLSVTLIDQGIVNEPDEKDEPILMGVLYDMLKEQIADTCRSWEVKVK